MLKSFQIENFNSIKEPIVFSMEADLDLTEHKDYMNNFGPENNLLRVASIYGPNASGKSNLLHGIRFVRDFISGRLSRENPRIRFNNYLYPTPFEFTSEKEKIVTSSLLFVRENKEYWYKFSAEYLDEDKRILKVDKEFLGVKVDSKDEYEVVFSREGNLIMANEILNLIGASRLPISNDMPLLRHLYVNYIDIEDEHEYTNSESMHLKYVSDIYEEIYSIIFISNLSSSSPRMFRFNGKMVMENKDFIVKILNKLDIQISDIDVKEIRDSDYQVYCIHEVNGQSFKLRIEQESQGTALLVYLLAIISSRRNRPTIFLIDELDSHLHPKLVAEIIRLFNSKLNISNQLIFNSHDMWNLTPDNFRRDQIWFTYRNSDFATELICLSDIVNYKGERVRKDAKFSKQYMEGKYGADPFIRKGLDWND